jgi:ATP-dependent Clp protease ATP-binding subunit ClpB
VTVRLDQLEKAKAEEKVSDSSSDEVTAEAIAEIVARWTNIPVTRLMSTEKEKLLTMEKTLAESVVGQPEAVRAVANAIRLSRSGLRNAGRPIASFLFAGPSGTGKTLLTKTLATVLFDSPDAMVRIDGSEYSEKHSISRLIGAPPGYVGHDEGGQLTEYVRRKPYSIVLIDEIGMSAPLDIVPIRILTPSQKRLRVNSSRSSSRSSTMVASRTAREGSSISATLSLS